MGILSLMVFCVLGVWSLGKPAMLHINQAVAALLHAEQVVGNVQSELSSLLQPVDLVSAGAPLQATNEIASTPQKTEIAALPVALEQLTVVALPSPTMVLPTETTAPTATPIPEIVPVLTPLPPAVTATPYAVVKANKNVNVRSGPGTSYGVVDVGRVGAAYAVSGCDKTGAWIRLAGKADRWIAADLLKVTGNLTVFGPQPTPVIGGLAQAKPVAGNTGSSTTSATPTRPPEGASLAVAATGDTAAAPAAVVQAPNVAPRLAAPAQPPATATQTAVAPVAPAATITPSVAATQPAPSPLPTDTPAQPQPTPAAPPAAATPVLKTASIGALPSPTPQPPAPTATPTVAIEPSPTATAMPTPFAVIVGNNVNIRSGPGTDYDVVALAADGATYPVAARTEAGDWLRLAGSVEGWVSASFVKLNGQPPVATQLPSPPSPRAAAPKPIAPDASAAEAAAGPAPTLTATVVSKVAMINVRAGPGLNFGVVGIVRQGAIVAIAGQDVTGEWIRLAGAQERWVTATVLQFSGTLPVVASPEPR